MNRVRGATEVSGHAHEHVASIASRAGLRVVVLATCTVLLLALGWVVSGLLVVRMPALAVATGRVAGSAFILGIITGLTRHGRSDALVVARRPWTVAKLAFIGYFLYFAGTTLGVSRIGASRAGLIVALMPCFTFVVGVLGFGERVTARKVAGAAIAALAAIGYAITTHQGTEAGTGGVGNLVIGIGVTTVATIAFAVYSYAYNASLGDVKPESSLAILFAAAACALIPATAAVASLGTISPLSWLASFALGAVFTAPVYITGHMLFLIKGPLFVATISLAVPFLVRIGDWGLGQASAPNIASMGFMALCLIGISLVVRQRAL
jgi:drug/metabolite transporter (DMT)-like permease